MCAISISTSFAIISAGTIHTTNAEAAFLMQAEEFIKLAKETMYMTDKFKQKYEDYEFTIKLQAKLNNEL